jgi:hypothetical protein
MGIKYIHVTLIIVSIALSLGFGLWNLNHDYAAWGYFSFAIAAGLVIYCVQFVKKMKVL